MRIELIVGLLSIVVSLGMVVVIMGQHKKLPIVEEESEKAKEHSLKTFDRLSNKDLFKESVENLLEQAKKVMVEIKPLVPNLDAEKQKKEKEHATCQTEKQTRLDELAQKEKEHTDTEAPLKVESDAWKEEIAKLEERLKSRSPICDFLKADLGELQLCAKPVVATA